MVFDSWKEDSEWENGCFWFNEKGLRVWFVVILERFIST